MKLITLLAIEIYKDEIINILKKAGVLTFSYSKITGYRDNSLEALNSNWFGTEMNESCLLYTSINRLPRKKNT